MSGECFFFRAGAGLAIFFDGAAAFLATSDECRIKDELETFPRAEWVRGSLTGLLGLERRRLGLFG